MVSNSRKRHPFCARCADITAQPPLKENTPAESGGSVFALKGNYLAALAALMASVSMGATLKRS
ncbi:hypothetical protein, partial [uncultured Oscillibacter sp.]|uniref:hypothetical protein n=1 Tax=uncultured Oscillibacter sp. TaxID=876091 RepID=UPI002803ECEC